jgi:hypothetical protein
LQDGEEVFFRVKGTTRLKKLMNAYCDHKSVRANSFVFLFDGRRINGEQTPGEVRTHAPPSSLSTASSSSEIHRRICACSHRHSPLFQLEMEEGDTIAAMLPQTGG